MHPDDVWQDGYDTGYEEGIRDSKKEMEDIGRDRYEKGYDEGRKDCMKEMEDKEVSE